MENFRIDGDVFERMGRLTNPNFTRKIATEFGTLAVNFSKERFVKKDWQDRVHQSWKPRKRQDRGSLMVRTGRLKRSIRKLASGENYVIIGTDVPYAKIHNDGGKTQKTVYIKSHSRTRKSSRKGETTVKSHSRKMNLTVPQRRFMGQSRALELRLMRHLRNEFTLQIQRNL